MSAWTRVSKYAERLVTPTGTYHVAATKGADGWKFAAWPPPPPSDPSLPWTERVPHCLSYHSSAAEARAACERHANDQST